MRQGRGPAWPVNGTKGIAVTSKTRFSEVLPLLPCSPELLAMLRSLKQPGGGTCHVDRPPPDRHVRVPLPKLILPSRASLQTMPDPRTLGLNGHVGPLLKSQPTETMRDSQRGFKPLSLGAG